jgi:hypothetical protein
MIPRRCVRSVLLEDGATAAPDAAAEQDLTATLVPTATAEPMTTLQSTKPTMAPSQGRPDTRKRRAVFAPVSERSCAGYPRHHHANSVLGYAATLVRAADCGRHRALRPCAYSQ